ncbi:MAG: DUF3084 domain-containing protein [Synergistaceae bacterium]|nr:DUF3084 domain-containing protein [Synergistaceae bacterium]
MQLQIWSDINWTLIIAIIAGSAVLAFLGDILGSKYGRQRISIFGLRPRYTSRLITAFTGIFISVVVLTVMSLFSRNVRALIFTMKYLQQQMDGLRVELQTTGVELEKNRDELFSSLVQLGEQQALLQTTTMSLDMTHIELERSRNDRDLLLNEKNGLEAAVASLRGESEELKRELEVMRLEVIAVQANALLAQTVILPETPGERAVEILSSFKERVRVTVFQRFFETRGMASSDDVRLTFDPAEESAIVARVSGARERFYLRAMAAENIAFGEDVRVRLECNRSYLLYDGGETLYRKLVDPGEPAFNAEESLHVFLRELRYRALRSGILPDPSTNSVGSLEGEDFFDVVEAMKRRNAPTIINAVALEDIYTEGPVRIKIVLE